MLPSQLNLIAEKASGEEIAACKIPVILSFLLLFSVFLVEMLDDRLIGVFKKFLRL